jgi:spore germination protein YaaH
MKPKLYFRQLDKKSKFKVCLSSFVFLVVAIFLILFHFWEYPLVSPLANDSVFEFLTAQSILSTETSDNNKKIVYGFLPYWNLDQTQIQPELTHLSYFGLNINTDGTILIKDDDGDLHPGYARLNSDKLLELANEVNHNNNQFEITLVQFEADKIVKIANDEKAHENLIKSLDSILLAYPISGINIDIEYGGTITPELRDNFASLVEKISYHVKGKFGDIQISIDMYASASDNKQLWDVPRIGRVVDYIVVMAYDFHRTASPRAGPVAPLFGNHSYDDYIHQNLHNYLRYVPKEKILLGIPFYGYEWQVDSHLPRANAYPDTGRTATYQRVQKLLTEPSAYLKTGWDERALCPYLSYEKDDNIYMIYYENTASIEYKLEYVKQLDLAGVAIWALGYEGETRDFWDLVEKL